MTSFEIKKILETHRPGGSDAQDPEIARALDAAQKDPELKIWLEQQESFHAAMQAKFREIPVPANLKENILAQTKVVPLPWWQKLDWRAAAAIVFLVGLGILLAGFWPSARTPDRFADYQSRMVRSALREYRMELLTNDMTQVRQWMASRGAPADFSVPDKLSQLELSGGGVLRWRNHPVSMICFDRGDKQMLFLFVMKRSAVDDPPPAAPEFAKVSKLATTSWSEGDKTYLLAGPDDSNFLQKYH